MLCLMAGSTLSSLKAAIYTVPAGASQATIQGYINGAVAGDTVKFTSGSVYTLTGALTLKSGVTIDGNLSKWYNSSATTVLPGVNASSLSNVLIKNLTLDNVMFRFWASSAITGINGIELYNCTFQNGRAQSGSTQVNSFYLQVRGANVAIKQCRFLRGSAFKGKGIQFYLAENCTVQDSLFGTSTTTSPNFTTHGYFKTAINVANSSTGGSTVSANSAKDITITRCFIYRNPAMSDTGGDAGDSDHGIYAHGFDGLTLTGNTISGWAPMASGGAIKIRNGINALIQDNTLLRSGVLMYIYSGHPFLFLKYVDVLDNTITLDSLPASSNIWSGIGFWRNYATTSQAEYSVLVARNTVNRGYIRLYQNSPDPIHVSDFGALSGGCSLNTVTGGGSITLQRGMVNSGNSPAPIIP